jgi:hypothetical protein
MLTIKDLPAEQRDAWRGIFERLIFEPIGHDHIPEHAKGFLKNLDEEQAEKMRRLLLGGLDIK